MCFNLYVEWRGNFWEYVMKDFDVIHRAYLNKADIKSIILKDALICFSEHGIESTTIEIIKKKSEISVGSIYHHFKNKEGIIASLIFIALDDLNRYMEHYLLQATNFERSIAAIVLSYVDWVDEHPLFAEVLFSGKFYVFHSQYKQELEQKKLNTKKLIINWFSTPEYKSRLNSIPLDLILSLIFGITEHYCKNWVLGRVDNRPKYFRRELALSAWKAVELYF